MSEAQSTTGQTTELAGPPLPQSGRERENIPRQIGKFRILDLLAQGMALVYKAEQDSPKRVVALKMPRGGRLLAPEARERFLREVRLAASIDHSSIVPVLEVGEIDGTPYYTMPFIQGRSLADFVVMDKPDLTQRLTMFQRVCSVVQSLHGQNLVHRDLKPENIMIDQHGDVRLLDFGLAKTLVETESHVTTESTVAGTLQFMAPEQTLAGQSNHITPAADVYSLGVILYGLITGKHPYVTTGARDVALAAIREAVMASPSKLRPDLGTRFDGVTMACLARDPAKRPQTAGELVALLNKCNSSTPPPMVTARSSSRAVGLVAIGIGVVIIAVALGYGLRRPSAAVAPPIPLEPASDIKLRTTGDPDPVVRIFSRNEVAGLSGNTAFPGSSPAIPTEFWPVYSQVLAVLREDFAHHQHGAVLFFSRIDSTTSLSWQPEAGSPRSSLKVEPGGAAVVYLSPGKIEFLIDIAGRAASQSVKVTQGEVAAIKLN